MAASTLRRCSAAREPWQGDGQVVVVQPPKLLKGELGLEAGVDEDQGDAGALDDLIDLGHGVVGGMAGPGHLALGQQHVDHWRRAARAEHEVDLRAGRPRHPALDHRRIVHRRRKADAAHVRGKRLQPGEVQRQKIAALGRPDRMDLVDDDAGQVSEIEPRPLPGAEQGELFRRGQKDVGRLDPLALAARHAGVAGA
jgi:hypothetical protein